MKKIISLIIGVVTSFLFVCGTSYAAGSDVIRINDNFENSDMSNWEDDTGRGIKSIESDVNGKYMSMTSNSEGFFNFQAKNIYSTTKLYAEMDIKFTGDNAEIQLRESRDVSASGFTMAGRLRKNAYYIEYFSNGTYDKMLDSNGEWLQLRNVSKWYTIKMLMDIETNKYNIYLLDRDTQQLISKAENIPFYGECSYINYFAFSSSSELCVDNILIQDISIKRFRLSGEYYPKIPSFGMSTYEYSVYSVYENGIEQELDNITWSIKYPKNGVNINEETGELSIQNTAVPGPLMICIEDEDKPFIQAAFLVDLER